SALVDRRSACGPDGGSVVSSLGGVARSVPRVRCRGGLLPSKNLTSSQDVQRLTGCISGSRLSEMPCPNCGTENPESAKFCNGCGGSLLPVCSSCGTSNASGARFCSECGAPLAVDVAAATPIAAAGDPRAAPAAERRLVS